jgi:hypothetical protein
VAAVLPDNLLRALNDNRGGTTVIREQKVFLIRDVSKEDLDRIENEVRDVSASVESRTSAIVTDILAEIAS